jgi:hypothetical protein
VVRQNEDEPLVAAEVDLRVDEPDRGEWVVAAVACGGVRVGSVDDRPAETDLPVRVASEEVVAAVQRARNRLLADAGRVDDEQPLDAERRLRRWCVETAVGRSRGRREADRERRQDARGNKGGFSRRADARLIGARATTLVPSFRALASGSAALAADS